MERKIILLCAILLIALPFSKSHSKHHACIHDQIAKDYQPKTEPHTEGRMLFNGIEDDWKPFRVKFDSTPLDQSISNGELKDFLKNDLLPLAAQFLQTRLKVKRRTTPIKLRDDKCYLAPVPEIHKTEGISDADLIVYVTAEASNAGFAAWATSCLSDSVNGRPIAGQINFNLNYIGTDPSYFESYLGTTLHEITHVLGFSYWGFVSFIDPQTGKPRPKEELVEPKTTRGFKTTILKTKRVVEVAKEHFGCDSVRGVEMENQGGGGSLGSHFERTILLNEIMTASVIDHQAYSKFTLAVLEDSGWYLPNYELADEFYFGKNSGCDMFENACLANPLPKEYCRSDEEREMCADDYSAKAYCSGDSFADSCAFKSAYSGAGSDCRMKPEDNEENWYPYGEKFGASSKCVLGTLKDISYERDEKERAKCVQYKCESGRVILFAPNGKSATCNQDGDRVTIDGYSGYLVCPQADIYCNGYGAYLPCPNFCSGKGKCIRGKCECKIGRSGADCSQLSGCASNCNGNGVCQPNGACKCNSGWNGNACENQLDPCASVNCGTNGVCRSGRCVCNSGFTGTYCNEVVDPCRGVNCGSNGVCRNGACVCNSGWTGSDCNQRIDPCQGINCNNGVCSKGVCQCKSGWSGQRCEVYNDPCKNKKCPTNSDCRGGECVCRSGWTGTNCSSRANPCDNVKCGNGVCESGVCRCYQGWTGKDCSQKVSDPCANVNCLNGGRCSSGSCSCPSEFSGSRCETKSSTRGCMNNCQGRGTCASGKCSCIYPAFGDDCSSTYEQGCPDNTCSGNGICYRKKCHCNGGYAGDNCEILEN